LKRKSAALVTSSKKRTLMKKRGDCQREIIRWGKRIGGRNVPDDPANLSAFVVSVAGIGPACLSIETKVSHGTNLGEGSGREQPWRFKGHFMLGVSRLDHAALTEPRQELQIELAFADRRHQQ